MARIIPTDIARLELAGANRHEIATLRVLQARLPDDYTVFHGVHWTREWASETVFGELDFAVINRAGKALLVEQKNGTLEETDDDLIAHYPDRSKSVVRQVQRAHDNVRDKFRRTQGGTERARRVIVLASRSSSRCSPLRHHAQDISKNSRELGIEFARGREGRPHP